MALEWIYDTQALLLWCRGPKNSKLHAVPLTKGSKIGILHGAAQYVIQEEVKYSTESMSAGLDYPGISPLIVLCKRNTLPNDEEALKAYQLLKLENISPLEPSYAFAEALNWS